MPTKPPQFETLLYNTRHGVATITLNRPGQLNTIVPPMPDEIEKDGRPHDCPGQSAVANGVLHPVGVVVNRRADGAFDEGLEHP